MSLRPARSVVYRRASVIETAPAAEPVTADELRTHLRADSTLLGDTEANALIAEAREEFEAQTSLALITQSWRLSLDAWPNGEPDWWDGMRDGSVADLYKSAQSVELPVYPLASVTSVTTYDEDSNATAITVATSFDVDTYSRPGRISLQSGAVWPTALRPTNAIQIVYVAGYGDAADVPAPIKRAVKAMAAYLYAHRGDGCSPTDAYVQSGAKAVADRYRQARL